MASPGRKPRRVSTLAIFMNGLRIGALEDRGAGMGFRYDPGYLARAGAIPLSTTLPLTEEEHEGDAVLHYFENLLPEMAGARERLETLVDAKSSRPFDLLAATGRDCVGAVQLLPDDDDAAPAIDEGATRLSEREVGDLLRSLRDRVLGMRPDEEFRISVAGAQDKTALLYRDGQWHKPRGATPTTHILKVPVGTLRGHAGTVSLGDSVENEWLCLRLAGALGLHVAHAEIGSFAGAKALIVERFDRARTKSGGLLRLPQEDLCQALGVSPARKYQSDGGPGPSEILELLGRTARDPWRARRDVLRALAVFWILAAPDGHAKNMSVFLRAGGRVELTPFYDIVSVYPYLSRGELRPQKLKMAMALRGTSRNHYRWNDIVPRYFVETARRAAFSSADMVAELRRLFDVLEPAIREVEAALPRDFPDSVATPIFDGVRAMARFRDQVPAG